MIKSVNVYKKTMDIVQKRPLLWVVFYFKITNYKLKSSVLMCSSEVERPDAFPLIPATLLCVVGQRRSCF